MELILQEKSVQNSCRQMQTVLDLKLRAMSMFGLISKNYHFLEKLNFYKKWPMVLGRTFPVSTFLYSVTLRHYSNDAKEVDILNLCGLLFNGG